MRYVQAWAQIASVHFRFATPLFQYGEHREIQPSNMFADCFGRSLGITDLGTDFPTHSYRAAFRQRGNVRRPD